MATLRPSAPLTSSPNAASLSPSPRSGHTSPGSPSTAATSTGPPLIPTDEEVEAVIKQATSTKPTPDGRPGPGKDTRTQLFTGNLPYRVRWQDLKDLFRRAGTVLRADVSLTPDNRSRGYGTVLLASAEDAGRAVDMFNGYNWQGRVLEVRLDRLGATPGPDIDANAGTLLPGATISPLSMGAVNGLTSSSLNGLHVPSPHPALPFVSQQSSGNGQSLGAGPAILAATSSLGGGSIAPQNISPLDALNPGLIAIQQQQQKQAQQDLGKDEFLINQGAPGRPSTGTMESFLGALGRGLSADLDRERPKSNLGSRSLFIGNLPFHCQWQDLKDLFRQAGTILRADVSLGPDGRSRGFGTVTFANEVDAERAVAMFNGFDYSGRILKVHYDKFGTPSPLPSSFSPHASNLATPVQLGVASTHAALVEVSRLQQLVSGQTLEMNKALSSFSSKSANNGSSSGTGSNTSVHSPEQLLGTSSQSFQETFPMQSLSRPTTSSGIEIDEPRTRVSSTASESSASPFSFHVPGTSPGLAERRQKVPPPIGTASASTSRRGSNSGLVSTANIERRSVDKTLLGGPSVLNVLSRSPASPTKDRRPTGQLLPVSSTSLPLTSSGDSSSPGSKRPVTASSVPMLSASGEPASSTNPTTAESSTSNQIRSSNSAASTSTSPRSSHPAHPGPISLPPPPSVSSFPLYSPHHHPMSPSGHPISPPVYVGYPSYGPMSPMHSYPLPAHMHPANMTPHGLPPITPSMPSFSFVPQPSPSVPAGGSSAIPPTPAEGIASQPEGYNSSSQTNESSGNSMANGMGVMPMSPPMHFPHHVFQPFTPGTVVSPGAFYGRPNGGPPRGTYLNPAVGSPVLVHPPYGFPHPGSQPSSPFYQQGPSGGPYGEESGGYFPPVSAAPPPPRHEGYFPPVSASRSSALANEILRDGSSMNAERHDTGKRMTHDRNDSGSALTSSENGLGEDTDAEHMRTTSSGATSWKSDDNAVRAAAETANSTAESSLKGLAQDMASVRLGSSPKTRRTKHGEDSHSTVPATDARKNNVQRTESASSVDDKAAYPPGARHTSFGEDEAQGYQAHGVSRRTHSAQSSAQVRLVAEAP